MRPELVNRVFTTILGIWAAFLLRRETLSDFRWQYAACVVAVLGFFVHFLHAAIATPTDAKRLRWVAATLGVCALTSMALAYLERYFYGASQVPDQATFFLGGIVAIWLLFSEAGRRLFYDDDWYHT